MRFLSKLNAITFADEAQLRMALKVYLDTWFASRAAGVQAPPVREGRRMRWLERVLEPARAGRTAKQWRRMQAAIALTIGTDAMVILRDVCRLEDEEAQEVLLWAARALLRAALDEPRAAVAPRAKPPARRRAKSA